MDTLGFVIDKLMTVNLKTFHNWKNVQADPAKQLNLAKQRAALCEEIEDVASRVLSGQVEEINATRPQHKTY